MKFSIKSRMSPVRGLKDIMPYFPFADPKTSDRIAEALIKAGVPGNPTDNYRISRENLINGQEVKSLLFGRKITGTSAQQVSNSGGNGQRAGNLNSLGELIKILEKAGSKGMFFSSNSRSNLAVFHTV